MGVKTYNPVTAGLRYRATVTYDFLTPKKPEKSLSKGLPFKAGRDSNGRISVRRRGGRHKRKFRVIDFHRNKHGIPAVVRAIEYDPNRSTHIALLFYKDGEKRYIVAPQNLKVGMVVESGDKAAPKIGNCLPLAKIPLGTEVHNIELQMGKGAQLVRAAGTSATLAASDGDYVTIRLPSGETRMVFKHCHATIGAVGNADHMNVSLGKAGASRWIGRRPKVRGVVMNPVDHPHGGGEGRTSGGRHPVSPWGTPTKGYKTRKKRKPSEVFIITRGKKR